MCSPNSESLMDVFSESRRASCINRIRPERLGKNVCLIMVMIKQTKGESLKDVFFRTVSPCMMCSPKGESLVDVFSEWLVPGSLKDVFTEQ